MQQHPKALPPPPTLEEWIERGYRAHVNVKFEDPVSLPWTVGAERGLAGPLLDEWLQLEHEFPGITLRPLCPDVDEARLERVQRRVSRAGRPVPRLANFFTVECPRGRSPRELEARVLELTGVERARLEDPPARPPSVGWQNDPLAAVGSQRYLHHPPAGVGATTAWRLPGSDGSGSRIMDLEQGWFLIHEDLPTKPPVRVQPAAGLNHRAQAHGTSVLGILLAVDNAKGCVGLVPRARCIALPEYWSNPAPSWIPSAIQDGAWHSRARALYYAFCVLGPGEVLLVESQIDIQDARGWHGYPVEHDWFNHTFIELACLREVVVVECAGFGYPDDLDDPQLGGLFTDPARDSGAIFVSGGAWDETAGGFARAQLCNYGHRVDCFSWGSAVVALTEPGLAEGGSLPPGYTSWFNGTSSAGAIVAGCATIVQGVARSQLGRPLPARAVRRILRDPSRNTRTLADRNLPPRQSVDLIGVQPRLDVLPSRGREEWGALGLGSR